MNQMIHATKRLKKYRLDKKTIDLNKPNSCISLLFMPENLIIYAF